ncbi:MAG: zinc dependent phospholipase C family protein [Bacillota bacterium]
MLKLLLTAAIPFQGLVDRPSPTHGFINRQALAILRRDGRQREAAWLGWYLEPFIEGCDWADTGWKNIGHMYDPETGTGLRGWPSAPQMLREYWDQAERHLREGEMHRAAFCLGAASHLVQDLCVPHHAAARIFAGHKRFEAYARRYRHLFGAHEGGQYGMARTPEGWVLRNADYTRKYYSHCLTSDLEGIVIHRAVVDLLPRAQRTTAGFVAFFLSSMGVA